MNTELLLTIKRAQDAPNGLIPTSSSLQNNSWQSEQIIVLSQPNTNWSQSVDSIEAPFAPEYDNDEYRQNNALSLMGFYEMRELMRAYGLSRQEQLAPENTPLSGKNYMVVGTGTGREVINVAKFGGTVTGIDATIQYPQITQSKLSLLGLSASLFQCPAENFPFENFGPFDGMSSLFGVLNHVQDWERTLSKMADSIKPQGNLVISLYGPSEALAFSQELEYQPSILQKRTDGGIILGDSTAILPASFPKFNEVKTVISEAGLRIDRLSGYLKYASLFPRNIEDLPVFLNVINTLNGELWNRLKACSSPEEMLLTSFVFDQLSSQQENINDFAYFQISATKL